MDFVNHLFGRSRQRVTQEVKAGGGGDSRCRSRCLSEVWDLLEIRLLASEPPREQANSGEQKRQVTQSSQPIGLQKTKTAPIGCERNQEATMDKKNRLSLRSSEEHMSSNNMFGKMFSNSDLDIQDKRVTRAAGQIEQLASSGNIESLVEFPVRVGSPIPPPKWTMGSFN